MNPEVAQLIDIHSASGRRFEAGGVRSFVREEGRGPNVLLLHGVPTSSFLYRKVIPRLADQGIRAVALDFPGLGLADRPRDFDYSWGGLASWLGEAVDALELERVHLVVHDIAGPIGGEWAVANPDRVLSLTALNTDLAPATFTPPMKVFAARSSSDFACCLQAISMAFRKHSSASASTREIGAWLLDCSVSSPFSRYSSAS